MKRRTFIGSLIAVASVAFTGPLTWLSQSPEFRNSPAPPTDDRTVSVSAEEWRNIRFRISAEEMDKAKDDDLFGEAT